MVESTGLENRQPLIAVLGFKSLSLRHYIKKPLLFSGFFDLQTLISTLQVTVIHSDIFRAFIKPNPRGYYFLIDMKQSKYYATIVIL